MYHADPTIGGLMPNKVYMPEENRLGGGVAFFVSWNRMEGFLRGNTEGTNIHPDETCEFVVGTDGIMVYVEKT